MAERSPRRLVLVGSVVVDLVLYVDALPDRGGDVLAERSLLAAGGGFNVLSAAARQGLPAAYGGLTGTGPFGDLVRRALADDGVEALLPAVTTADTGVCVALVEASGERTFATTVGAEAGLAPEMLAGLVVGAGDAVYVSGYDLVYPHGPAVAEWFGSLPDEVLTVLDPGPLAADIPRDAAGRVLRRLDWLSLTARELALLAGERGLAAAVEAVQARAGHPLGVVVRDGARGATVHVPGGPAEHVPAPRVERVVDTNGAGDVHVGAFLAALGRGEEPVRAVTSANEAAALSVTRAGPASAARREAASRRPDGEGTTP